MEQRVSGGPWRARQCAAASVLDPVWAQRTAATRRVRRSPVALGGRAPPLCTAVIVAYLCNMHSSSGPIALAFSGGLDTSYCVPRLADAGWEVHTVHVDTGGSSSADLAAIRTQADRVGAFRHHEVDARAEVYDRFVRFLIQGNVLRGEVYPLSVAAERTQQALSVVETARRIGVTIASSGASTRSATSKRI